MPIDKVRGTTKRVTYLVTGALTATLLLPWLPSSKVDASTQNPLRWNNGGAVWSTSQEALDTFLNTGAITDRGLEGGLNRSGWTSEQIRTGLNKIYTINFLGLAKFLYSPAGEEYLNQQTRSYVPYWTLKTWAVEALRSAIILDAQDGTISGAGIFQHLPVDFRSAKSSPFDGIQNVASLSNCKDGPQCTSLFSWMIFLPADLNSKVASR
jgi:hypothetical protein